jgi:hypothetical protein
MQCSQHTATFSSNNIAEHFTFFITWFHFLRPTGGSAAVARHTWRLSSPFLIANDSLTTLCLRPLKIVTKRGEQIFQKSRSYLKILDARRVTWSTLHTEDPQVLGTTIRNLFAITTWRPGLVCYVDSFSKVSQGVGACRPPVCVCVLWACIGLAIALWTIWGPIWRTQSFSS